MNQLRCELKYLKKWISILCWPKYSLVVKTPHTSMRLIYALMTIGIWLVAECGMVKSEPSECSGSWVSDNKTDKQYQVIREGWGISWTRADDNCKTLCATCRLPEPKNEEEIESLKEIANRCGVSPFIGLKRIIGDGFQRFKWSSSGMEFYDYPASCNLVEDWSHICVQMFGDRWCQIDCSNSHEAEVFICERNTPVTTTPHYEEPVTNERSTTDKADSTLTIVGIVVGCLVGACILITVIICACFCCRGSCQTRSTGNTGRPVNQHAMANVQSAPQTYATGPSNMQPPYGNTGPPVNQYQQYQPAMANPQSPPQPYASAPAPQVQGYYNQQPGPAYTGVTPGYGQQW